jgi:hypothetical protein
VKCLKVWTEVENEQLKAFVAQDVSVVRVAAVFKRTIIGVRYQARKLGTPFPPMKVFRRKWADPPSNVATGFLKLSIYLRGRTTRQAAGQTVSTVRRRRR